MHSLVSHAELSESLYRPYKCWFFGEYGSYRTLLIKREEGLCIAACPELGIRVEDEDYLTATGNLQQSIKERLNIPQVQVVTSTCIPAFDVTQAAEKAPGLATPAEVVDGSPEPEIHPIGDDEILSEEDEEVQFSLF